jgi:ribosomal protein S9
MAKLDETQMTRLIANAVNAAVKLARMQTEKDVLIRQIGGDTALVPCIDMGISQAFSNLEDYEKELMKAVKQLLANQREKNAR